MRRFASPLFAAASLIGLAAPTCAETRARSGGTLVAEFHDSLTLTDPGEWPNWLVPLVYDHLVRLDEHGEPQPALAASWQHDAASRRWEFRLRPNATFHDGTPVTAAAVVASLKQWTISSAGDNVVVFQTEPPAADLPVRLAGVRNAILSRGPDGATIGTGPFRIAEWQAGRHARLGAYEGYWGGRPFVDFIELQMGVAYRDQTIDLELGKADLIEISLSDARRAAQQAVRTWTSAPVELLALVFERGRPATEDARLRQAVALSIDRAAIHSVLLQRQGEPAGALLPEWLTGYAFLFPTARDLDRARDREALIQPVPRLTLSYDPTDPLARLIAERIALNAREVGVVLQVSPGGRSDVRLVKARLSSLDAFEALADFAAEFGLPWQSLPSSAPEALFQVEQKLLDGFRVVPLFYVPRIWGLSPRVRNWDPRRWGEVRLDNVWLEVRRP